MQTDIAKKINTKKTFFILVALCCAIPTWAQIPVTANPDHQAMLASTNPVLAANKKLVYDFWRNIIEAGHVELASTYMAESYIQHNPNIPTGRNALVELFGRGKAREIANQIKGPLVSIVAEGDLVVFTWVQTHQDPANRDTTYTTTAMDMFRVENGKLAEHWDINPKISTPSVRKAKPNAERKEIVVSKEILNKYSGIYQLTPDMQMLITVEENQLIAQATGDYSATTLYAESNTQFFSKFDEIQIDFLISESNTVTQLIAHKNGRDFNYLKLADQF